MQALEPRTSEDGEPLSEVLLQLYKTNFPQRYLPKGANGERLDLPASARLTIGEQGIKIDVIIEEGRGYYGSDYEPPDFAEVDPPIITFGFHRDKILRLVVGGRNHSHPIAILVIADPTEVDEGFTLTFASTDSNNPNWHIMKLTKHVRERLGVTIEEVSAHATGNRRRSFLIRPCAYARWLIFGWMAQLPHPSSEREPTHNGGILNSREFMNDPSSKPLLELEMEITNTDDLNTAKENNLSRL